jgi:hypothetical protein
MTKESAVTAKKPVPYTTTIISNVVQEIINERTRQATEEKFTPSFDDDVNDDRELAAAAATYAFGANYNDYSRGFALNQDHSGRTSRVYEMWPSSWDFAQYKPTTARRDLVKSAALCIAEIERLDRAEIRAKREAQDVEDAAAREEAEYGSCKG